MLEHEIRQRLAIFAPISLYLQDSSARHMDHAEGGSGHFTLRIVSAQFAGKQRLARHRMIYSCLDDLIKSGRIHALTFQAFAPDEINTETQLEEK